LARKEFFGVGNVAHLIITVDSTAGVEHKVWNNVYFAGRDRKRLGNK
jgi:hypothetical protein